VLHGISGSAPVWRAHICLREKNLPYEAKVLEMSKGDLRTPEYLALNPRGQVPVLQDGDTVISESLGILQYLETVYPQPPLLPEDKAGKGHVIQRCQETANLQSRMVDAVRMKFVWKGTPEEVKLFAERKEALKDELQRWEDYLASGKGPFICGSSFSLADVALAPFILAIQRFGASYAAFPNILKYADLMKPRPSVVETWPEHWKGTQNKDWLEGL